MPPPRPSPSNAPMQDEKVRPTIRQVSTPEGDVWRVYERDMWLAGDVRRRRELIFDRQSVVRRVRRYPADWMELSDRQLLELAEGL